jgi:hypothetical protein
MNEHIYILYWVIDYEGQTIIGAYSSLEKAQFAFNSEGSKENLFLAKVKLDTDHTSSSLLQPL